MVLKVIAGLIIAIVLFLGYVSTRNGHFKYERSGVINAKPEAIYPYVSQFKLGQQWSPYEKDPDTKRTFGGPEGQAHSFEEFESKQMGSGRIEIIQVIPNQQVDLRLQMFKPFPADNRVTYRLAPDGEGTRFIWSMEGDGGFMGKLMATLIDCENMIGGQFDEGIANLKRVVEKK
jgi:hypothetical protein